MAKSCKEIKRYSISFKQQAVKEMEEKGRSLTEVRRHYGINGGDCTAMVTYFFGKKSFTE